MNDRPGIQSARLLNITEDNLALEFAERYSGQVKYVPNRKWFRLVEATWQPDNVISLIRELCREVAETCRNPADVKWLLSAHTVWSVEWLCRSDRRLQGTLEEIGLQKKARQK